MLQYYKHPASVLNFFLVYFVRPCTDRFLASGLSDSQLYLVPAPLVTSEALIPFSSMSKSAAISGQTVSRELHSQSFCPAQQGQPDGFLAKVRLFGQACQLCTLPFGHAWHCHQMSLLLRNVVLSGKFPLSLFFPLSHCCSKACSAAANVGCFCLVPSAFRPAFALAHLGHPDLPRTLLHTAVCHSYKQTQHFQWAFMLLETVTWSDDMGWFFLASQSSATSGAFLASVLC